MNTVLQDLLVATAALEAADRPLQLKAAWDLVGLAGVRARQEQRRLWQAMDRLYNEMDDGLPDDLFAGRNASLIGMAKDYEVLNEALAHAGRVSRAAEERMGSRATRPVDDRVVEPFALP